MDETTNLQPILDYYRTRCHNTEYEYLVYQQKAQEKIAELESVISTLTGNSAEPESEPESKSKK